MGHDSPQRNRRSLGQSVDRLEIDGLSIATNDLARIIGLRPEAAGPALCEKASPCPCVDPCQRGRDIARRMSPRNPVRPCGPRCLVLA